MHLGLFFCYFLLWNWTGVYHPTPPTPLNFASLITVYFTGGQMGLDGECTGAQRDCPLCWKVTKRFDLRFNSSPAMRRLRKKGWNFISQKDRCKQKKRGKKTNEWPHRVKEELHIYSRLENMSNTWRWVFPNQHNFLFLYLVNLK